MARQNWAFPQGLYISFLFSEIFSPHAFSLLLSRNTTQQSDLWISVLAQVLLKLKSLCQEIESEEYIPFTWYNVLFIFMVLTSKEMCLEARSKAGIGNIWSPRAGGK